MEKKSPLDNQEQQLLTKSKQWESDGIDLSFNDVKDFIYDKLRVDHQDDLNKYDNLINIFFENNDEIEFRKIIKQKEEFLRQLQMESVRRYLEILDHLTAETAI